MDHSEKRFTIGTAGHVDHGKSTLIKALTGINPDRLQEEIERQMTIDLGFAWMTLANGFEVGIIDVPGHRDFIDNMLAGVGSIDAVLFVIAADEGIMPQTREHLAILDLLQVKRGIIVITKADLVDEEWLTLVMEEVEELVSTTTLEGAPVLPVSATTGGGLDILQQQLVDLLEASPGKSDQGRPRLPIDRVFTLTGFGTVVTGTLIGGSFNAGDEVEILPKGVKSRIRNLQSHKSQRERAEPGSRVALNLSGVRKTDIERGDVVALQGQWTPTTMLDARFRMLPDLPGSVKHNQEVKLYSGAAQRIARLRTIGQPEIKPGEECWVQLILNDAIIAERGDYFILRRPSPGATLGGGQIMDPLPQKRYRLKDRAPIKRLETLLAGDPGEVLLERVRLEGPLKTTAITQDAAYKASTPLLEKLIEEGRLIRLGKGERNQESYLMAADSWNESIAESKKILAEYHQKNPLRPGMPTQEFKARMALDAKWATAYIEAAVERKLLKDAQGSIKEFNFVPAISPQQEKAVKELLSLFDANPYNTPSRRDVLQVVDEELLQYLIWNGQLVQISSDVFFTKNTYADLREKISEAFQEKDMLTVAEVRDLFQTSRKYALALMEHLDQAGFTVREGDARRLAG